MKARVNDHLCVQCEWRVFTSDIKPVGMMDEKRSQANEKTENYYHSESTLHRVEFKAYLARQTLHLQYGDISIRKLSRRRHLLYRPISFIE